ncbi:hypothetical protein MPC4_100116 [Methylocella tundrae]|uniref:Uncharacterized protein n=1 Tax=Methylocella tundrae TaxID=227605 RepID=A0A8B6M2U1_METTU|nr:hypothetical protein MPC1_15600001 [Methylocella tundrae]VTZ48673.1 hypothetical protein MPC4_100116 [Methylocella tundrae]
MRLCRALVNEFPSDGVAKPSPDSDASWLTDRDEISVRLISGVENVEYNCFWRIVSADVDAKVGGRRAGA